MISSTKLNTLTDKQLTNLLRISLQYCTYTFGINKRKKTKLQLEVFDRMFGDKKCAGCYDPIKNTITLFLQPIKTVGELLRTFVHEYTHYLQPCRSKYMKLYEIHGYNNHPFEIEAYQMEKTHGIKLLNVVKKHIK